MHDSHVRSPAKQPCAYLHQAPRIAARDELRRRLRNVSELGVEYERGCLRLDEIVDTGAATALVAVGERDDLELGNGAQYVERRDAHALRVQQVAGRIVRDSFAQRTSTCGARRREQLADVAHL